jgi:hypothetical protein
MGNHRVHPVQKPLVGTGSSLRAINNGRAMPLDQELIDRLLANKHNPVKKRAPGEQKASTGARTKTARKRFIVSKTQYPDLVPNKYVKRYVGKGTNVSTPCTSHGCRAPSYHLFSGSPLCSIHLIYALVYELDRITTLSNLNSINSVSPLPQVGIRAGGVDTAAGSPASTSFMGSLQANAVINTESGEDDEYL